MHRIYASCGTAHAQVKGAGKPPTGGTTLSLKLAKDTGTGPGGCIPVDPLKPGFTPGRYVLVMETSSPATGPACDALGVISFATLTIDAGFKCTIDAADSVDGDGSGDLCGTAPNLCAPSATGKCSVTSYQIAGIPNYASRARPSRRSSRRPWRPRWHRPPSAASRSGCAGSRTGAGCSPVST